MPGKVEEMIVAVGQVTAEMIGLEIFLPARNLYGVVSDVNGNVVYVGGRVLTLAKNERVVF
jgi:hypothetical protein